MSGVWAEHWQRVRAAWQQTARLCNMALRTQPEASGSIPEATTSQCCVDEWAAHRRSWVVLGVIDHEEHDGDDAES